MQFDFRLKKYLNKKAEKDWQLLIDPPQKMYDTFIIIPAKAESKNIPLLLDSISNQNRDYLQKCLTIIVINSSSNDSKNIIDNNNQTIKYLSENVFDFDLSYVNATLPLKNAGVGLSRKIGADLALDYCNDSSVICYTDADVLLSKNYLKTIMNYYSMNKCGCAIVGFKHQKNSEPIIEKSIQEYENFLIQTAKALKKTVECDRIGISVIGLEVPHAHLHLIPINQEGDMNFTNEKIILSENEFKNLLSRIKSNLD